MKLNLNVGEKGISVQGIEFNHREIIHEIKSKLGADGVTIKDGKVVRWIANPYYDDFAEHTHDSPGHYEQIPDSAEDIELVKAVDLVCKALDTCRHIGKKKV